MEVGVLDAHGVMVQDEMAAVFIALVLDIMKVASNVFSVMAQVKTNASHVVVKDTKTATNAMVMGQYIATGAMVTENCNVQPAKEKAKSLKSVLNVMVVVVNILSNGRKAIKKQYITVGDTG